MFSVAICGGSGYTGVELLRLLLQHPDVEIKVLTSEKSAGKKIYEVFPHLKGISDLTLEPLEKESIKDRADIFFLALPHGTSQEVADYLIKNGKKVIDLSADYRLKDPNIYEQWYKTPHRFVDTLSQAVYGLPELYREKIKKASLIANPGCYPTGAILALYPALKAGIIDESTIIIDAKSGVSGAGRKAELNYSFSEVNESFRAYGITNHRHTPEIEQIINEISGRSVRINFTPHLLPLDRGILTTAYVKLKKDISEDDILHLYREAYKMELFIRITDHLPDIKYVRGINFCDIKPVVNKRTGTLIVVSAIDNLVKGAAGQAIQNMNIILGIEETKGLRGISLFP
ncbi:MAG: N-acetyl-gamma-glutamyl-phosphate reductase [Thermodesulfovibrionales bacterium]|nr:N-acetyl-gamma-glutamyl-phosphate reductase [Thermodesulfovibrionales bacterium]